MYTFSFRVLTSYGELWTPVFSVSEEKSKMVNDLVERVTKRTFTSIREFSKFLAENLPDELLREKASEFFDPSTRNVYALHAARSERERVDLMGVVSLESNDNL